MRSEARFGVRSGDRILRVDDTAVRRVEHLAGVLRPATGPTVYLLLRRDRREMTVPVNAAAWRWSLRLHRHHPLRQRGADPACPCGHGFGYA